MKKRIYIDMDDTLCEFSKRHAEKLAELPSIAYPHSQYGFFANLDPIPGAIDAYRLLEEHFEVYILTAPSFRNPLCYTEKRVWVEKHLGIETTQHLIICQRKGLLKGDFLIDDRRYEEFEGEQLQFGSEEFPDWNTVCDYLLTQK